MHIHVKVMEKIIKDALVDDRAVLNICYLEFLQNFGETLMIKLQRKSYKIRGFDNA